MNRFTRWGLTAAVLLPMAACSGTNTPPPVPAPPPPALSQMDRDFITQAGAGGLAEVQLGALAAKQAARPAVRQFGQQMVDAHTPLNQQLDSLAQAKGITPPANLDPAHQAILTRLQREHGARFDSDYLRGQVADHQAQLNLFQTEANEGTDPDLKNFAATNAPMIQQHLTAARGLLTPARVIRHHTTATH
jgi:putative membrane protein